MPSGSGQTFTTQPNTFETTFTSADTTVAKNIIAGPGGYWRLNAINITSDDTAAQVLDVFIRTGSTNTLLGSVSIPAGSGKNGVVPVNFMSALPTAMQDGLDFAGATGLQAALEATMTAAKTISISLFYSLY